MKKRKRHGPSMFTRITSFFRWFDSFLVPPSHKLIVVGLLTIVLSGSATPLVDFLLAILFPVIIVWAYISCRKYGWLDTTEFVAILPFMLIPSILFSIFKMSQEDDEKRRVEEFTTRVSDCLMEAINEAYSGKIIESRVVDGQMYITVETPYGVRAPAEEIRVFVSKKLHISPMNILHDNLSDTRSYYLFDPEALKEYETYKSYFRSIDTLMDIKARILCQREFGFSRRQQPESFLN